MTGARDIPAATFARSPGLCGEVLRRRRARLVDVVPSADRVDGRNLVCGKLLGEHFRRLFP